MSGTFCAWIVLTLTSAIVTSFGHIPKHLGLKLQLLSVSGCRMSRLDINLTGSELTAKHSEN